MTSTILILSFGNSFEQASAILKSDSKHFSTKGCIEGRFWPLATTFIPFGRIIGSTICGRWFGIEILT